MSSADLFLQKEHLPPFNEMMISWNGQRPEDGTIEIYASVKLEEWTPWILYASWGHGSQSSNDCQIGDTRVYQDAFEVLDGKSATGFRIKTSAPLRLHVYTNGAQKQECAETSYAPVFLDVKGLSQMRLKHPRKLDLCSPTATVAALQYLTKKQIDPIAFAEKVKDHAFDIYGNWVLNVAESSVHLGSFWSARVQKCEGFSNIYQRLISGVPVVVSVRGPLPGSALPYSNGHLIVVTGFDPMSNEVCCMDPAFESDEKTHVRYRLDDFLQSWRRRGNLAYIFEPLTPIE